MANARRLDLRIKPFRVCASRAEAKGAWPSQARKIDRKLEQWNVGWNRYGWCLLSWA